MTSNRLLTNMICLTLMSSAISMTVLAATADDFRTEEYQRMGSLDYIHAAEAYAKGYSGKGITLGVRDQKVRQTNGNFTGKHFLTPYTYDDNYNWKDHTHGSHVAGTMAAVRDGIGMHGISYNADLMSLGTSGDDAANLAFLRQYPQVKVVNNSIGLDYYLELQDLSKYGDFSSLTAIYKINKDATLQAISANDFETNAASLASLNTTLNSDKLFVFSASNEGYLSTSLFQGIGPFYNAVNKNNILSVIACSSYPAKVIIDGDTTKYFNGPAYFSNLAMFTEDISLTAPGYLIGSTDASTTDATKLQYDSGTSMAAPHVTGVLGLVQEAYPYLNAKQLGDVVLSTTSAFPVDTTKAAYTLLSSSFDNVIYGMNLLCYDNRPRPTTQEGWRALIMEATGYSEAKCNGLLKFIGALDANKNILLEHIHFYNNVPLSVVFGQGLLNADLATNGLGSLNAKRLAATDVDTTYRTGTGGKQALYKVNTAGYNSVWSNNITETRVLLPGTGTDQDADLAARQAFYRQYAAEATNSSYHKVDPVMANKVNEVETYITKYNAELAANPLLGLHVGLFKEGEGILRLTGTNTYQGSSIAAGGTLAVDGSVAGDAYSTSGGTLAGMGTINGNVYNQGTLLPGTYAVSTVYDTNPAYIPGTLTIKGNLNSTGALQIGVNGTNNSTLAVNGISTLTGSTLSVLAGHGPLLNRTYPYLTSSGGIIGNAATSAVSPYVSLSSTIDGTNAYLMGTQTATLGSLPGMSPSENSVGAALNQRLLNASSSDPNGTTTAALNNLLYQDSATSNAVLKQVTNETQATLLTTSPLTAMTIGATYDRLDTALYDGNVNVSAPGASFDGVPLNIKTTAPMTLDTANNLWIKFLRGYESYGATTSGGYDLSNKSFGGVIGYDRAVNGTTRVGGLFSYAKTDYSTDVLDGKSHDWRVGVYASHDNGTWKTQGLISYGHNRYDFNRYVLGDKLYSDYTAKVFDINAKVKYLPQYNRAKSWQVGPYAGLAYTHSSQGAYTEEGSSLFAQNIDSSTNNSLRAEVGVEWKHAMNKDSSFGGSVGYKRVLSGVNPELNGTFAGDTNRFTLSGDNDRDDVTYSVNLKKNTGHNWTMQGEIRGERSKHNHSEVYSVMAKYSF